MEEHTSGSNEFLLDMLETHMCNCGPVEWVPSKPTQRRLPKDEDFLARFRETKGEHHANESLSLPISCY
jgi:hypothetical protein